MYKIGNENLWSSLNDKAAEQGLPLSPVVAEIMHLSALDAIFYLPESQQICFQGGTCIHLLYGGYRYSEDLGFAGEYSERNCLENNRLHSLCIVVITFSRIRFVSQNVADCGPSPGCTPCSMTESRLLIGSKML